MCHLIAISAHFHFYNVMVWPLLFQKSYVHCCNFRAQFSMHYE